MDTRTAHILNTINQEFYRENAVTFSSTRSQGWQGWERLAGLCAQPTSVLDIACGNQRFKTFLEESNPGIEFDYYGVDACDELVTCADDANYQKLDIIGSVLEGHDLKSLLYAPQCDLVVCFGFMHHVPGMEARMRIMELLKEKAKPNGIICVSFWRFIEDQKLAAKAHKITESALKSLEIHLDEGDYFLDWQGNETSLRYCHTFTDDEISQIIGGEEDGFEIIDRFVSDGRNQSLNTYVVLKA